MKPTPPSATALDENISDAEVAEALAAEPTPYLAILEAAQQRDENDDPTGAQDYLSELGAGATGATPAEALANAAAMSARSTYVGIGYCLRTVRTMFELGAMWPDAATAYEQADGKHPAAPADVPRGAVIYWTGSRYGHVALAAGGGMCWTTDYRRPGYVDLAPIEPLARWCGATFRGWAEELNGVDVWPTPEKPKPPAPKFDQGNRINTVRAALERAKKNDAPAWRVNGLARWLRQLENNADGGKK